MENFCDPNLNSFKSYRKLNFRSCKINHKILFIVSNTYCVYFSKFSFVMNDNKNYHKYIFMKIVCDISANSVGTDISNLVSASEPSDPEN